MQPRNDVSQRCISFRLNVSPKARVLSYRDFLGNHVHHFGIPGTHRELLIVADAIVEVLEPPPMPGLPDAAGWEELDALVESGDYWEMLTDSHFARPSDELRTFAASLDARRRDTPLSLVLELNAAIYRAFDYTPSVTTVDSPIEVALEARKGVCQDFAHVTIAVMRMLQIPARYVSGYLYHRQEDHDRSSDGASHAWVEVLLPQVGWLGIDPTNDLVVGDRHIRAAIGRDYADVSPTKGVFKGGAETKLSVNVRVAPVDAPKVEEQPPLQLIEDWAAVGEGDNSAMQQQQQQQQ